MTLTRTLTPQAFAIEEVSPPVSTPPRKAPELAHGGTRLLVIAAALVIITWGIFQAQTALVSLLVSIFFAILGTPPVVWLERRRVPRVAAVLLVVTGMVLILLAAVAIVGASLTSFSAELPAYQDRMRDQLAALQTWLATKGILGLEKAVIGLLNPGAVMGLTARLLTELGSALSNIVLVMLTIVFILFEASSFPDKLRAVLGDPEQTFPQVTKFVREIVRYVVIKTLVSLVTGLLVVGWLSDPRRRLRRARGASWPSCSTTCRTSAPPLAAVPAVLLALVQLGPGYAALAAWRLPGRRRRPRQRHRDPAHGAASPPLHAGGLPLADLLGRPARTGRDGAVHPAHHDRSSSPASRARGRAGSPCCSRRRRRASRAADPGPRRDAREVDPLTAPAPSPCDGCRSPPRAGR